VKVFARLRITSRRTEGKTIPPNLQLSTPVYELGLPVLRKGDFSRTKGYQISIAKFNVLEKLPMLYFNKQISSENYNIYCVNSTTWYLIPHAKVILFRKKSSPKNPSNFMLHYLQVPSHISGSLGLKPNYQ